MNEGKKNRTEGDVKEFWTTLKQGLSCKCPKCQKASMFPGPFQFSLHDTCPNCGLDLTKNDSADGPAVFLIFILGFVVVPAAIIVDLMYQPSFLFHLIVWTSLTVFLSLASLKPIKSYVITLQYKHLPWDKKDSGT